MNAKQARAMPIQPTTLVELLQWRANHQMERTALTFLLDGEHTAVSLTYAQLNQQACTIATALLAKTSAGERALLLYQPGMEYITAFLGCLYAGVIAVPAYLPSPNRPPLRLQAIVQDAQPALVLSTVSLYKQLQRQFATIPTLAKIDWLLTDADTTAAPVSSGVPHIEQSTTAFIQYTSGSTASPKGVMVSHANLLANLGIMHHYLAAQPYLAIEEEHNGVSWLPPYHDMGLIGGILLPLYSGAQMTLMSPVSFLQKPQRWLEAISRTRAAVSAAPDFAYALCARKIPPEQRVGLDLSNWQCAVVGAEPVRATTLAEFSAAFAQCQFKPEAFQPCYGLAEATLMASSKLPLTTPVVRNFDAASLEVHTVKPVRDDDQSVTPVRSRRSLVSCGQSVIGQQIVIVAPDTRKRCHHDEIGEIWVQGSSVAAGYWHQPESSTETFQAYLADSGEGPFLRTGDLGFFHLLQYPHTDLKKKETSGTAPTPSDTSHASGTMPKMSSGFALGELYITGRLKDLIILHGRNHYPQDLELTAQLSHPLLSPGAGAAFSMEQEQTEKLVLVHELERHYRSQEVDLDAVIAAIRNAIWEYHELDVSIVALLKPGSIPKTSSGKIQRRACRDAFLADEFQTVRISSQEQRRRASALHSTAPRTPQEELLSSIWLDVLGIEHIGVFDSFVDVGGDSLQAAQIVSRIRDTFQLELPLQGLLASPTIAEQARQLEQARLTTLPIPALPITATSKSTTAHFPLSCAQERMWFFEQTVPGSTGPRDNLPMAVRLRGALEVLALTQSFEEIIRRHAVLRTTFNIIDDTQSSIDALVSTHQLPGDHLQGSVFQVIHPYQKPRAAESADHMPTISCLDLTTWSEQAQDHEVSRLLREEQYYVFDLKTGPLLHIKLVQLTQDTWVLLVNIHHIIFDGWSMGVFVQELFTIYAAFVNHRPAPLPDLPIQYVDYALWQRQWLQGEVLQHKLAYWQKQLAGVPALLPLPTDFTRPAVRSYAGKRYAFPFAHELSQEILAMSRREGVTLFMLLLTAYTILLYQHSRQADIVVGSMLADRTRTETEQLLGLFINPVALRTKIDHGTTTFRELLHQVRTTTLAAYTYQDTPFQYVVEQSGLPANPAYTTLFQVMLTLQNTPFSKGLEQIDAVTVQPLGDEWVDWEAELAPCDLELHIMEDAQGGLRGNLYYSTDLFREQTIQKLVEHFQSILQRAVSNPEQQVQHL